MSTQPQRLIIAMMDGLGLPCLQASPMPFVKQMAQQGFFREVRGVYPSVTNVNNVSIACGAWPAEHGISANSYFDPEAGCARYMNASGLIRTPTIFQRAAEWGVPSALLTSKRKTAELLGPGTDFCLAAEDADPESVARYGPPPPIYSREINYWLWAVALDLLQHRPDLGLIYVHITDYPMHAWGEDAPESQEHLAHLDDQLRQAAELAPDAAILLTADHGMNFKMRSYDLEKVCAAAGTPVRFVLSPERDYYIVHHRNFTGCSWVWLRDPADEGSVRRILEALPGVEEVLTREKAAARYHSIPEHLGDLLVNGDRDTMFGVMDVEREDLPPTYRAHGSMHEMDLPLLIHNYRETLPPPEYFRHNLDLTRFLFRS
ncbi:MAG: alkaline phosphatase family protein [Geothrix sp.]